MSHKYEYTGDGTHTFPTIGKQPQPGDQIESDEPLNSPFLKEISTPISGATPVTQPFVTATEQVADKHTPIVPAAQPTGEQTETPATPGNPDGEEFENDHHEEDEHTEGAEQ